jgi:hypothetical protein
LAKKAIKKWIPYKRDSFDLNECKVSIQIVGDHKDEYGTYGTAFLNVKTPDGRWIPFVATEGVKVRLDHEEASV